jgi:hypothetical protein
VIPVVVGSSPISHPKNSAVKTKGYTLSACSPFVFLEDEFQILEDGMGERNKYGLGRTVPAAVKREVRQRCGFGCVRCGLGFYDYEHFAPDFKDATAHNADGITLLCMQCNQKRARGQLSAETVAQANAAPRCRQEGFTREEWGFGHDPIEVVLGSATFIDIKTLIEINGYPIISIQPPENGSTFYRLSALFSDRTGQTTLRIVDNEWFAGVDSWDVECVGQRITIKSGPGDISLVLRSEPPRRIVIERLNMQCDGVLLRGDENLLEISTDGKDWVTFTTFSLEGAPIGISIDN